MVVKSLNSTATPFQTVSVQVHIKRLETQRMSGWSGLVVRLIIECQNPAFGLPNLVFVLVFRLL